jgi:release factor glutamine methyltransferase
VTDLVGRLRAAGCVFAEEEAALLRAEASGQGLETLVRRREAGTPLEHLLGWAEFDGHRVLVTPGVFVPRRRSEALVEAAALACPSGSAVVVDLCCGTGALGAAVARRAAGVRLWCVDVDPVAVACARDNVAAVGGTALEGDLAAPLPASLRERVDVLLASPPYVPSAAVGLMPAEARLHEQRSALDGGPDGLAVAHDIVALAPAWLSPSGTVLVEVSRAQGPVLADVMRAAGLTARVHVDDDRDATVVVGCRPTRPG